MARYRRVNIDGQSLYKTETRTTAAAVGNYVEEGRELALRCLPGAYKKDSPIKLGTAGQFTLATSDTDSVIGYSQDEYTVAASTTDYIRVRMRVGTVAAGA